MEVVTQWHPNGGRGAFSKKLGRAGWEDSQLAQKMPFEDWWAIQCEVLESSENYVVYLWDGLKVLGGAVLLPTYDAQVGKALSVWHQFLLPEARGSTRAWREVIRACEAAASLAGLRFLIWTHRDETTGRVYLKHKEVQNGKRC